MIIPPHRLPAELSSRGSLEMPGQVPILPSCRLNEGDRDVVIVDYMTPGGKWRRTGIAVIAGGGRYPSSALVWSQYAEQSGLIRPFSAGYLLHPQSKSDPTSYPAAA